MDPAIPQSGFSRASRRTSARMLRRVAGRPVLPHADRAAQRRRTMSRCQRTIVSGVISSRSPWHRAFGMTPSSAASRARSAQSRFGRRGCRRCSTLSWWRRIKISAVFHISSRRDSRSPAATRVIRRNTNRRHMIGDHHGRTAEEQPCWSEPWMRLSARTGRAGPPGGHAAHRPHGRFLGYDFDQYDQAVVSLIGQHRVVFDQTIRAGDRELGRSVLGNWAGLLPLAALGAAVLVVAGVWARLAEYR
jgi:hypothetical protein